MSDDTVDDLQQTISEQCEITSALKAELEEARRVADQVDDMLSEVEDITHGGPGNLVTRARSLLRKVAYGVDP